MIRTHVVPPFLQENIVYCICIAYTTECEWTNLQTTTGLCCGNQKRTLLMLVTYVCVLAHLHGSRCLFACIYVSTCIHEFVHACMQTCMLVGARYGTKKGTSVLWMMLGCVLYLLCSAFPRSWAGFLWWGVSANRRPIFFKWTLCSFEGRRCRQLHP